MMKRILGLVLSAALMVTSFAGCGSNGKASSGTDSAGSSSNANAPKETVTLRVWGGVPPESGPQASCDLFNEKFKDKGIQVEYERFVNDDTGNLKLETSLMAGSDVDLYMSYGLAQIKKRADGNMALDLTELMKKDNFNMVENFSSMAEAYYVNGKPYSLPTKLDQYGIVLNKDMFDAAGIAIPTEWTFDEFREVAKKLTKGEGQDKVYGMYWNSQQDLTYAATYLVAQTAGGDFFYKDGGKETNFDNPVFLKAYQLVADMMNADKSSPTHIDSVTQKLSQEGMFLTGKSAMTVGPWMVRNIKDKEKYPHTFKTAFAPYPVVDKGQRTYTQGGYGDHLSINPKSKNIDAAWEFAKWYASEGMLPLISGGRVPAHKNFSTDAVTKEFVGGFEDLLDADTAKNILIKPNDNYAVGIISTKLPEITKVFTEEIEAALSGRKTVEQALADCKTRGDALLK